MKGAGLLVVLAALAIIYAWLFALWDVLGDQKELSAGSRIVWIIVLLASNVLGTLFYLRLGPGAAHWPPWEADGEDTDEDASDDD